HNREDNYVFYDKNSPRISYLARNIQKVFNNRNITIVPTDNIGSDIKDYIIKHSENRKRIDINITPGTKSQSIALAQAARTMGKPYLLYSIKGDLIQNIVNTSISFEVIGPSVEDLIKCHALYYRGSREIPEIPIFLDIMKGLANKNIRPKKKNQKDILGININGRPVFSKNMSMSFSDCCYLDCILDGKTYVFPVDFLEDKIEGIWWEAVCAYVIKSNLTDNIIWSATWEWPETKKDKSFFSEIDIVFKWKNFICTVSCKTSAIRGSKSLTKFSIESKAKKHFGRFTLPFVAIPYDQYKDKDYAGIIEDGIMFLTPSIMIDPEKMEKKIIEFVKSKRTT
ncbi:MAG: hypothetical protein N2596_03485, partial [Syntrophorhabdaceae bacterium]|nr:hypothetical protein [Syntrophorhabdaceae bacterium]